MATQIQLPASQEVRPPDIKDSEANFNQTRGLVVDCKAEEERLQALISKLVLCAGEPSGAHGPILLENSVLQLSASEWQALTCRYPESEKSFRADVTRIVLRALGITAAIQEEFSLYRVRLGSEYLWERHWRSLSYLEGMAQAIMPELQNVVNECRHRGLLKKATELNGLYERLSAQLKELAASRPEDSTTRTETRGVDPKSEDTRLQRLINHLVVFAGAAQERCSSIDLPNTSFEISETEWEALTNDSLLLEKSFRADLGRILRRAVGILAGIQEDMKLYGAAGTRFQKKSHLTSLAYLKQNAAALLPDIEAAAEEARQRGLARKAQDIAETASKLTTRIEQIGQMDAEWKRSFTKSAV